MRLVWMLIQFALCAVLIAGAGFALSRSGDRIGKATGLTGGWIGLALLATVTSLPELASGISAVTAVAAPNLAVGNALGACVFNLAFLAIIDAVQRDQPIYHHASAAHLLSAAFGVVMLGFVAMSILLAADAPRLLHLGLYSPLLLGVYLLALRSVHGHDQTLRLATSREAVAIEKDGNSPLLRSEIGQFGVAALVVLIAGIWLPRVADDMARHIGWSQSFVGTVFMAIVTTLPEMAVTFAALRIRALDMAIGNLLGSNLFNVTILAIDDAVYTRGPLLADASTAHAGTAVAAMVMCGLVMIGLVLRPRGRVLRTLSWISVGLLATYLLNATLIYLIAT